MYTLSSVKIIYADLHIRNSIRDGGLYGPKICGDVTVLDEV